MKVRLISVSVLMALSLSGCSKFLDKFSRLSPGLTLVRFSDGKKSRVGPPLTGGIMVYATRSDGFTQTIKLASEDDDTAHALSNGEWTFQAVGYPTNASPPADNMAENPRCAESAGSISLMGTNPQTVTLAMDTATCKTGDFADAGFVSTDLKPLEFNFCDHASLANTFTGTSDPCGGGRSSPSFKSSTTFGTKTERVQYDALSDRFTYIADTYGSKELFSAAADGTNVIRQNSHFVTYSGRAISDYEMVYDEDTMTSTGKAVYLSDDEYADSGKKQLYVTTIGQQGSVRISPTLAGGLSVGTGVQMFKVSKDGRYVVFAEKTANAGPIELYAVDLESAGLGPTSAKKLSHSTITGDGLQTPSGGAEWDFKILPDSDYVAFAGKFTDASMSELYLVPIQDKIDTPANDGLITKISHTAGVTHTAYFVNELRLSYDGTILFWKGNPCSTCPATYKTLVYGTDLATPTTPGSPVLVSQKVTGSVQPAASLTSGYWVSETSDLLAFNGDIDTGGMNELWIIDFGSFPTMTSTKVDNDGSFGYSFVKFSPAGTKVVFLKGDSTMTFPNDKKINAVPVTGGTVEILTPSMTQGFDLTNTGGGKDGPFKVIDENRVFYIGDVSGGVPTLRMSSIDGTYDEVSLIGTPTNGAAFVKRFDVGYDHAFLTMDGTTAGFFLPYKIPIGSSPTSDPASYPDPDPLEIVASMVNTEDIHVPPPQFQSLMGTTGAVFLGSRRGSSSPEDSYFVLDFQDATEDTPVKLSHIDAGSNGSGRFRVSLRGYGAAGNETAGISSQCFKPGATDGVKTGYNLKIPYGLIGADVPFQVKVEIFPNGESCSGSPQQVVLSEGLANYGTGSSDRRIVTGASLSTLFLSY